MSLEERWQALVGNTALHPASFEIESSFPDMEAIHFLDESVRSTLPKTLQTHYWNIQGFSERTFSKQFQEHPSAAVLVESASQKLPKLCKKLYFLPSTHLGQKKEILRANPQAQVNLGVDPYNLGLWKSQLLRSSLPEDFLGEEKHRIQPPLGGKTTPDHLSEQQHRTEKLWSSFFSKEKKSPNKMFRLSSLAFDLAGANPIQQLAIQMAAFVQLVEDYKGQLDVGYLFSISSFEVSLSPHLLLSVAKIQSLRLLLSKMVKAYGLDEMSAHIVAICCPRYLATREPHNNLLRLAVMNMAAIMAGANGMVNLPYDLYSHNRGGFLSRNMDLLLKQESMICRKQDPLSGSYTMDTLVESLNRKAWGFFQEILRKGGLCHCLQSGWLQEEVQRENEKQLHAFQKGEKKMTGVNEFVLIRSLDPKVSLVKKKDVCDIETWWSQWIFKAEQTKKICDVRKLTPVQISECFEAWQFRADAIREKNPAGAQVPVYVEPGLENSSRWMKLVRILNLFGLEAGLFSNKAFQPPVFIILASDPEGTFVKETLQALQTSFEGQKDSDESRWKKISTKSLRLWFGERRQKGFDDFIGESSDRFSVFEKIFKILEKDL